jgi:hypothetical protein
MIFWVATSLSQERPDVSEEYITSNFRTEEYAKQETSKKQAASRALPDI